MAASDWNDNLVLTDSKKAIEIAGAARRVAVLGCQVESKADRPAFYVPQALQQMGVTVVPVPAYHPDVTTILGEPVYRKVASIPGGPLDIVDVFRKPSDLPSHLDDLLAAAPACVWLQSGIRNPEFEEALARAGIVVVADRCLMVDRRAAAARL